MLTCPSCRRQEPDSSRFCTRCGTALSTAAGPAPPPEPGSHEREEMNLPILYAMVGMLIVALLFPPWETPPGQPPEFLGFRFILDPPAAGQGSGVISRLLMTIELTTIAVAGLYLSWLFRKKE